MIYKNFMADVIDTGWLVAIKGHKTVSDTDSVAPQPQNSYWHREIINWSRDLNSVRNLDKIFYI